jgi:long-chain fatty acid transport protein
MHKPVRTLVSVAVVGILATSIAHAGAFALYTEDSPAAIGNYAAGIAAEAADASTGWYNPAGLALIHKQEAVFGGVGVFPTAQITGSSTFSSHGLDSYVQNFNGLNGGDNAFVPAFHYALPLGENATFGLSVVSPFGLDTDWTGSPVRYQGTFTELITANISPEIGAKVTENFAVGAGLDLQYARVKFNTTIGLPTLYTALNPAIVDTLSYNNGNSVGVGFHVGVMGMFNDNHTRLGLNYQSEMNHTFHGQSRLFGPLADPTMNVGDPSAANGNALFKDNSLFSNPVVLPDVLTASAYHDLNETIALLGSVVYTGWSSFKLVTLNNVAAPAVNPGPGPATGNVSQVQLNATTAENYSDSWRVSAGANYHVNDAWMLRVGGGYDESPTSDIYRDVRLPDVSRWALSIGAHYQMRPAIGFDVGYTHLFQASNGNVNRTEAIGSATFNVNSTTKASVDLVGAQVVWVMDKEIVAPTK